MAFQPGLPGSQFPSDDALIRRIQDLEKTVQQLAAANPFAPMGMRPMEGGVEFTGDMKVAGTLDLPSGIIGNAALASPVTVGRASQATTGFTVTSVDQTFSTVSIPIPAGYTQALVFVVCNVGALNPTANNDFLYSKAVINGVASREVFGYVANNSGSVAVTTAKSDILTNLSGGSITCAVTVSAGANWTAKEQNRAYVEAQAIFLR